MMQAKPDTVQYSYCLQPHTMNLETCRVVFCFPCRHIPVYLLSKVFACSSILYAGLLPGYVVVFGVARILAASVSRNGLRHLMPVSVLVSHRFRSICSARKWYIPRIKSLQCAWADWRLSTALCT